MNVEVGTFTCPYQLVIVGGGPAGVSIVVRAVRLGVLDQLCKGNCEEVGDVQHGATGGICIIDQSAESSSRFGGGRLTDYVINSNTFAAKFVTNVTGEKLHFVPKEVTENTILSGLENTPHADKLLDLANKPAPLATVGKFWCDVGAAVKQEIQSNYSSTSKCLFSSTVLSIEKYSLFKPRPISSCGTTTGEEATDNNSATGTSCQDFGWKVIIRNDMTNVITEVYAKTVTLATGGLQELPSSLTSSSCPTGIYASKMMTSDMLCSAEGIKIATRRIRMCTAPNSVVKRKVVIVGGSHSAFSAAWVCLNRIYSAAAPADNNTATTENTTSVANEGSGDSSESGKVINAADNTAVPAEPIVVPWGNSSICILHRSPIQVFFATKKEATEENYTDIGIVNKTTGQIHPFGGLRGNAKELWKAVKRGVEGRVRLQQLRGTTNVASDKNVAAAAGGNIPSCWSSSLVLKLFEEAAVIVWACGYHTNTVPIKDIKGKEIPVSFSMGQVEVNEKAEIMLKSLPATGTSSNTTGKAGRGTTSLNTPTASSSNNARPAVAPSTGSTSSKAEGTKAESGKSSNSGSALAGPSANPASSGTSSKESGTSVGAATASSITLSSVIATKPIVVDDTVVGNLFGCGLGYGLKALFDNGEPDGSSGRADGVAVYLKRAAALILARVLGTDVVYGPGISTWEERVAYLKTLPVLAPLGEEGGPVEVDVATEVDGTDAVALVEDGHTLSEPRSPTPSLEPVVTVSPRKDCTSLATSLVGRSVETAVTETSQGKVDPCSNSARRRNLAKAPTRTITSGSPSNKALMSQSLPPNITSLNRYCSPKPSSKVAAKVPPCSPINTRAGPVLGSGSTLPVVLTSPEKSSMKTAATPPSAANTHRFDIESTRIITKEIKEKIPLSIGKHDICGCSLLTASGNSSSQLTRESVYELHTKKQVKCGVMVPGSQVSPIAASPQALTSPHNSGGRVQQVRSHHTDSPVTRLMIRSMHVTKKSPSNPVSPGVRDALLNPVTSPIVVSSINSSPIRVLT